jgi:hypothetical protein
MALSQVELGFIGQLRSAMAQGNHAKLCSCIEIFSLVEQLDGFLHSLFKSQVAG